jgi:AcrR family transcriptional regulator
MTPNRPRGRPRSEEHRDAVLKAAMELMREDDLRRASVDRISARSGVSKATIYKWCRTEPQSLSTRFCTK